MVAFVGGTFGDSGVLMVPWHSVAGTSLHENIREMTPSWQCEDAVRKHLSQGAMSPSRHGIGWVVIARLQLPDL